MTNNITQDIFDFAKNAKSNKSIIIKLLEEQEEWTVEFPEIQEKIENLLSNWKDLSENGDIKKESIMKLISYLSTGDMINFLHSIEKIDKEFIEGLLESVNKLNENQMPVFSMLLAKRLLVIYRLAILPRIFSEERLKALEKEINNL